MNNNKNNRNQSPYKPGDIHNGRVIKKVTRVRKSPPSGGIVSRQEDNRQSSYNRYDDYGEEYGRESSKNQRRKSDSSIRRNGSISKRKKTAKKKKSQGKKLIIVLGSIAALFAIAVTFLYMNFKKIQSADDVDKDKILVNDNINPDMSKYRTIALFGVDSRRNTLKKGNRSDSIMIVSIHKTTQKVRLLSIYRDTYAKVPEHGMTKINHAYSYGGAELALSTINTNFDLNITEFATVNFQVMSNIVDQFGGIEVEIDSQERIAINKVIQEQNRMFKPRSPYLKRTGKQMLNGSQATAYARIRKTDGGDFRRAERQRTVISKIMDKVKANPLSISAVSDAVLPKVYSNLSAGDITWMTLGIPFYKIADSKGFPFDGEDERIGGIYYGVAKSLANNVRKMHQFLYETEKYVPSKTVRTISNTMP